MLRIGKKVFHPNSKQKILKLSGNVFALLRESSNNEILIALTNITDRLCRLEIPVSLTGTTNTRWFDVVGENEIAAEDDKIHVTMQPYDVIWMEPFKEKLS
jgi:hypothetical protein